LLGQRFALLANLRRNHELSQSLSTQAFPRGAHVGGDARSRRCCRRNKGCRALSTLCRVERAGGPPVSHRTFFPAASLSKPVFAWAVQDLAKQGKIDWNRPLQDYVADLGLEGLARNIAALHVLTHSTGLANWRFQPNVPLASAFEPGTKWQYSGEGFVLLQRVVEKIVGRPIAEYTRTAVLEPLGMKQSTYAWTPEIKSVAALGHDRQGALLERSLAFYEQLNYESLQKTNLTPASATYEQIAAAYQQNKQAFLPVAVSPNMAGQLQTTIGDYAVFLAHVLKAIVPRLDDFKERVEVNRDILLLRLNLIAIYASFTADLRYLDALNYYYELLPSDWCQHNSSFLNFYLRALATHID